MDDKQKQDRVDSERLSRMFQTLGIGSFGRLYFVPEEIWIKAHGSRYSKKSNRRGHPGCSIRQEGLGSLEAVPMLHGTSRNRSGCVGVEDIMGRRQMTWFGGLRPVPLSIRNWTGPKESRIRSTPKLSLSEDESVAMQGMCVRKGWL